jgi:FkbM family methyltransferase
MLGNGGDEEMKLPFKMRTETEMEKYRAASFWDKEPETITWIKSFDPHDVFFDVGANLGIYSLFAASLYPEMPIFAFEPMPENALAFMGNVKLNGFQNITLDARAVGSHVHTAKLGIIDPTAGKSGAQVGGDGIFHVEVKVISIDAAVIKYGIPTHVKIDIDGQELEVVEGMRLTMRFIRSCLIEVSAATKGPVMEIFTGQGFTTDNRFNRFHPHSRDRRKREGIDAENIVFTR